VLLAGDAAHVHSPVGGQGLNTGVQDAVNLGWKLAQVVQGVSPDSLLDTYHDERHPVAARVLRLTMAQVALLRPGDARHDALRDTVADLLGIDEARRRYAATMSGLDIRYDLGEGHPLLGRRMPDLDLVTAEGPRRVSTLLHRARPVLLALDAGAYDLAPWRTGCSSSVPPPAAPGSSPCWARWRLPPRCWSGPTGTSRGWGTAPPPGSRTRSPGGAATGLDGRAACKASFPCAQPREGGAARAGALAGPARRGPRGLAADDQLHRAGRYLPSLPLAIALARCFAKTVEEVFDVDD
jgi:hypothetical protein